ncbi:hypothetical protein KP509_28G002700 [Ceratopteris richardii]|uniref:Uncoupling protein 3 n=1 Tax=Ceratopteris richardii TaxID=49495 RepID=A0A8T2RAH4_CERRI|nr:hypothetical protein KP509_28G002700 [Ceratopteris richardii]
MVGQTQKEHLGVCLALSSVSAVIAESATFPIDITKTRLQLQGEKGGLHTTAKKGAIKTGLSIIHEEGYKGLYKGLSPALLRHVFYTSTRIVTYEQLRIASNKHLESGQSASVLQQALLGGISGIIGQVLASPADLVKVRMQSDGRLVKLGFTPRYTGVWDAVCKIVKEDGILGLWRGVGPNAQRAFLVNMGELSCYDQSKKFIVHNVINEDNIYAHVLASMMSGLCATALSCPADVIKTRIMNQAPQTNDGKPLVYKNSIHCLMKTVRTEGVMALWKGFFPTWARLGPWQLIFWVSYEQLRQVAGIVPF